MGKKSAVIIFIVAFIALVGWSCFAAAENYFPLKVGNQWTYELTVNYNIKTIVDFIVSENATIDNIQVMSFDSVINGMTQQKEYYQVSPAGVFTILRKMNIYSFIFEPPQCFLKYPVVIGDSWDQDKTILIKNSNLPNLDPFPFDLQV